MGQDPFKKTGHTKKSWTSEHKTFPAIERVKLEKYDFEKMKGAATHVDAAVRKAAFIEYFERFNEFPSFLFDNESHIDPRLAETIAELNKDQDTTVALRQGLHALMERLTN
jgi:hypothetical protein